MTDVSPEDSVPPKLPPWLQKYLRRGFGVFVGWGAFVVILGHWVKPEKFGQWGDSFGPLTGIASTLAVVFAVWSVHMQRHELELQRQELRLTREEMEAQRKEMAEQRKAQQISSRAQTQANDIADLSNAVAIAQSRLAGYQLAIERGGALAMQRLEESGTSISFSGMSPEERKVVALVKGHLGTLDALHKLLGKGGPPGFGLPSVDGGAEDSADGAEDP